MNYFAFEEIEGGGGENILRPQPSETVIILSNLRIELKARPLTVSYNSICCLISDLKMYLLLLKGFF